jgi:hypothetical protein
VKTCEGGGALSFLAFKCTVGERDGEGVAVFLTSGDNGHAGIEKLGFRNSNW